MIVPDFELFEWAKANCNPFNPLNINPASIDLTWSGRVRIAEKEGWGELQELDTLTLEPGQFYLMDTTEYIKIPSDCVGFLALKSSSARKGIEHLHAGFFDPGFEGTATLEMEVRSPWSVEIEKGQRIVQLVLMQMRFAPYRDYREKGHYQGQQEPKGAWDD